MDYFSHFVESPGTSVGNWLKRRSRERVFKVVDTYIHKPRSNCAILEIGPGMGELTECFLRSGYRNYTVVEPNTTMRALLANRGIATRNYSIPRLIEEDESCDVIILADVFEHLNGMSEASEFVLEARRVLRQGGILCILSPDYLHWRQDFFNCDYTHSHITTIRRTMQLFHNAGFDTVHHEYFSSFVSGPLASVLSNLICWMFFFPNGNALDSKLYKVKLTFLRQFLIIGGKLDVRPTDTT